ncbi:MAG: hypothetical protein JXR84_19980 [Anaerolineae bacterium]|nr:hypothetical protein [Anaerolineae bacterium]
MYRRLWMIVLSLLGALLLTGGVLAMASPTTAGYSAGRGSSALTPRTLSADIPFTPTTIITVTSAADPDDSAGYSCYGVPTKPPLSPCTLRRALVEADALMDDDPNTRPILIKFDIPVTDTQYDAVMGVWVIQITETLETNPLPTLGSTDFNKSGQVMIDGWSQPDYDGIRSDQPRIVVRGPQQNPTEGHILVVNGHENIIRGLIFQKFRLGLQMNGGDNIITDNWFGLTTDGDGVHLYKEDAQEDGSGQSGIILAENASNNLIQNNHLLGYRGSAIDVGGDNSHILSNTVGTRVDGTVPEVRDDRKCKPNARYYNWFAGAGIEISGEANLVAYNRVVGLLWFSDNPLYTPDDAISVSGWDHEVHDNIIGLTSDGVPFGTCGEGIDAGGAGGAHFIDVRDNLVVGAHGAAGILVAGGPLGYDLDAVTVQGNVILDSQIQAFDFSPAVPAALRLFNPAAITDIDGMNVTGTSGVDSLCEDCVVEVFLDHHDTVTETLESLGTTTADGSGNWTFTLSRTLALTEGLRTASTTVADGQIHNASGTITYSAGTTTKISEIYTQIGAPEPEEPLPLVPELPLPVIWPTYTAQPTAPGAPNLVITVTTTADPDDSQVYVCYNAAYPGVVGKTNRLPCTLRQAIEEAQSVIAVHPAIRPVEIRFNIPTSDPGYDAGLNVWVIQITDTLNSDALPMLGVEDANKAGQVIIDGDSQPGGRTVGPKIIIRGPANRELTGHGLVVNGEYNVIRNLAFQDLRMVLELNHGHNIVEGNWFGLTSDGQEVYLKNVEKPEDGSGQSGITAASAATNTLIQNNILAGFKSTALNIESNDSYILNNTVGTRADGTVPEVTWNRWCRPNARYFNWFGGGGVEIGGKRNQVIGNRIAGLLWISDSPTDTPDDALSVTGDDHLIQENIIGVDALGSEVGSCGRGLVVDAGFTRVLSNTVVRTALEPYRMNGTQMSINALYYQGNLSWDSTAPNYMEFGDQVPKARSIFTPSVVLSINVAGGSTTVQGASHPDAPCPYCQVELFLDDLDPLAETFESLVLVQSDVDGIWQTTLPFELGYDEGLRTASTAFNYGIIANFDGPSTSRVSTEVYSRTGATLPPPPPDPVFPTPPVIPEVAYAAPPELPASYVTVITVTNTGDPTTSPTTCAAAPPDQCTLRRAIVQANALAAALRPVLIAFDIPTSDAGYNAAGFWKITLSATNLPVVRGGQVMIDGSTQPDGRDDGPKIVLFRSGDGSTQFSSLRLGEYQTDGAYLVRGLAFQNVELTMTGSRNIIEGNWLGLNDAGMAIYFHNNNPSYNNHALINGNSAGNNNVVRNNKLAGARTEAIKFSSDDNLIEGNTVGLLADGTISTPITATNLCKPAVPSDNWFGGGGIKISGVRNRILDNTIAGLLIYGSATTTPPDAIWIPTGQDNLVEGNVIGLAVDGAPLWTCGSALDVGTRYTQILSNTVVNAVLNGFFVNGSVIFINATMMQGNVISNTVSAIEFGDAVPDVLKLFAPALVTRINGVNVTGMADDPCSYCRVDVYRDDDDPTTEALVYLGAAFANLNGNWTFTLPAELEDGEGLRTQSTTRDYGVLQYFEAGTSSGLSMLFEPQPLTAPESVSITPPGVGAYMINQAYTFSADVLPITATLPITYTWRATDQTQRIVAAGPSNDQAFTWALEGTKYITVTADNGLGSPVMGTYSLSVSAEVDYFIYLPLVLRNM